MIIRNFLLKAKLYLGEYSKSSFSQEGEDLVLNRIFENRKKGFYVDIGAHHPIRFSNTYMFYRKGWRGINIDAMPGSMKQFRRERPDDTNLELAVMKDRSSATYYLFNEPALNTFSDRMSSIRANIPGYRIVGNLEIAGLPLSEIFEAYLPKETPIDFMSLDIEGLDFDVLLSNNWNKFRPKVIVVEIFDLDLNSIQSNNICKFLMQKNYIVYSKLVNSVFFLCREFFNEEFK